MGALPCATAVPLTSNADINDHEQPRQSAPSDGTRTQAGPRPRRGEIELPKRVSQVRILSGAPMQWARTDHGPGPLTSTRVVTGDRAAF